MRIFFLTFEGLSSVWLLFTNSLTQRSGLKFSWQLTRNVSLATLLLHSYRRSFDEDECSRVGTSRSSTRSQQFCEHSGHFLPPGGPVTSFLSQPISMAPSFPSPSFNQTKPLLSWITVVTKAIKRTARTSLYRIRKHSQCKNHGKHRWTVFSMNKTHESKQWSTNWRRRSLGDMQQQARRWALRNA